MDLLYYVRLARKNWKIFPIMLVLAVGASLAVTASTPPTYAATVSMLVSAHDKEASPTTAYQAVLLSQQRVKSYASLLTSHRVLRLITRDDDELRRLESSVSAESVPDTVILRATVADRDPVRAARLANALAAKFTSLIAEIERPAEGGPATVKVTVVDQAPVPESPVTPRPMLNTAVAILIALLLTGIWLVARDLLDTTVKTTETLQELAGCPALGVIGYEKNARRQPLILQYGSRSSRAEAFRVLRTNLQFIDVDRKPKSLVVTSCLPEEGKTSVAANLAIAFKQAKWRVILVDADLRRPRVASYLGIEGAAGLTDVLIGDAELADVTQTWSEHRLAVLPSGQIPVNPSELLASQAMRALVKRLTGQYDLVIIDTSPLLPVTDAAALAACCDDVLFVTRFGKTRRENIVRAGELLASVNAHIVGTVLNFVPPKSAKVYGYGDDTGYEADVKSQRAPLVGV
ncbi:polysaccharide biosynthesis tyrosine autokinase [Sphaerisporangium aureirubrum]|uniref:non-specific protein-tyrosine kinase n=1 Tax=Sphaerisporangium aureirubrum TaxID=1544736 RepID=A0ABW1NTL5_9ACTN